MDLIYKQETDRIIGLMYKVYNFMGPGYREKYYQRALVSEANDANIPVLYEQTLPVIYKNKRIGKDRYDLLFHDKIIVELKVAKQFFPNDFKQLNEYLKLRNLEIGLLFLISPIGIKVRRVANLNNFRKNSV